MDLVGRLKKFMDNQQISISQFADNCTIPRPTLSQILSGRNKKISDELIGKIHTAYPALSVSWLLFGEGDMLTGANIQISEAQKEPKSGFGEAEKPEHEIFSGDEIDFNPVRENWSENFEDGFGDKSSAKTESQEVAAKKDGVQQKDDKPMTSLKQVAAKLDATKRIKNIVVFYDDNTFQTFDPSGV